MRPVRLDLNGFACFRDPAVIDFSAADYFVFVGSTGSGKSTVIDAMTFALYGSAPRWGSVTSIQYALAPTANRCTVRLVFDVAGQRYAVAREVRRVGTQVMQKNALLERFLDADATGDPDVDEAVESLAADIKEVRRQVISLLGLEFDDFCTCVVLPQGDFATFLKASVTERQTILLKLLGASHYDTIGRIAGRRAAVAETRVEVLTSQLDSYAEATEEAEAAARGRVSELTDLTALVAKTVPLITAGDRTRSESMRLRDRLAGDITRLTQIRPPSGVMEIQSATSASEVAYEAAAEKARAASVASVDAEQAVQAAPRRQQLEETLRYHAESAAGAVRQPECDDRARATADAMRENRAAAEAADRAVNKARTRYDAARSRTTSVTVSVATLEGQVTALRRVRTPDGIEQLGRQVTDAHQAVDDAEQARKAAESNLQTAITEIAQSPEQSELAHLLRAIDDYRASRERAADLRRQHDPLDRARSASQDRLQHLESERATARTTYETLRAQCAAAGLRPHLEVGQPCPVCEQPIETLPPPLDVPELDSARDAEAATAARIRDEAADLERLTNQALLLEAQAGAAFERAQQIDQDLAVRLPARAAGDRPDPGGDRDTVTELIDGLGRALQVRDEAATRLEQTRHDLRAADARRQEVAESLRDAWADLHATRGALITSGAPDVRRDDIAHSWSELERWATNRADHVDTGELATARDDLAVANSALHEAQVGLDTNVAAQSTAHAALTAAAVAADKADTERQQLAQRLAELQQLLTDRPGPDDVRAMLADLDTLEAAAAVAHANDRSAAEGRQRAEQDRDTHRAALDKARGVLRRARDNIADLGAPLIDDTNLVAAWTGLEHWSAQTASRSTEQKTQAETDLADAEALLDEQVTGLLAALKECRVDLSDHGLDMYPDSADAAGQCRRVPEVVAVELERAKGRRRDIANQRRRAAKLTEEVEAQNETRQVAAELQRLMSSKRFPQWLADAALDTLVADASTSLMRLSNNQFDLTHDRGEFFVIDHTDADSRRSVRTLSGGETFQASLALALALSEQLATLAAGGRTTLDSIFLDEGFGTLDPDALEIVAGTLENLAQDDRMVGVVTHVAGLAERVPARYEVTRDSRTSSITRVAP